MKVLRFGYSEAVITPGRWITLRGYEYRFKQGVGNSGVLDDLYARALSLNDGEAELILITLDLCVMKLEMADALRKAISGKTGVPVENIMLSLSHTHSGPATDIYSDMNISDKHKNILENEIGKYIEFLTESIVTICSEAQEKMHKGRLTSTTLRLNLGYNRRYPQKDEQGSQSVKMHFSLWRHYGEDINNNIDEDIPVLMIEREEEPGIDDYFEPSGQKRIVLFSVPYHPVVLGEGSRVISADYPGAARECIEEAIGQGTKAMFLLGACGDINVVMACQENPKAVKVVGRAIGYGITAVLSNRKDVVFDGLAAMEEEYDGGNGGRIIIQTFKIGDSAIAAVSAECFSELGIRIRQASGYQQTLIASNSNGTARYIPSAAAFREGGYEVMHARKEGHPEDTLDKIIEKAAGMLNRMKHNN